MDGGQRVAIIGDLAGHHGELVRELDRLGADSDGQLPDDLVVVQVGDLVHRGPSSDELVALVDGYLDDQPEQWVQLIGNHEAQYVREPAFEWPERILPDSDETLRAWWSDGAMQAAVAVRCDGEDFLVTHAGLTEGYWRRALDCPTHAADAASALNSFIGAHDDVLFAAGQMLGGGAPDPCAGPLWAATATELVPGWLDVPMPFSQVHGHAMIADLRRGRLRCEERIAQLVDVDPDTAQETVTLTGGRIVGVDPGHGRRPHRPWHAFVLNDAAVLS